MQFTYFPVENLFQFWQAFYSWASTVSLTGEWWTSFNTKPEAQQHRFAISLYTLSKYFSYGKSAWNFPFEKKINPPTGQRRNHGESLPCERQWQRLCRLCKAGPFFLQWITMDPSSLHWRTYSVDLEPVYDLHPITNSPCQRLWHRHNVSSFFFSFLLIFAIFFFFFSFFFLIFSFFFIFSFFVHFFSFFSFFLFQVIFLTVNHRGPLPLRELHSTGETIVWRDPGGSWACL